MHGYLRPAGTCRAYESLVLGHRSVVLENRLLRATVLVDRGAALFELVWKPGDLDVLWRWERGIRPPGYQLSVDLPQGNFQDHFFGGWDLMFPTVDRFQPAAPLPSGYHGEVATLPWQWRLVADCADRVALEASVRCVRSPFVIRRVFCLREDRSELVVDTRFENVGTVAARYAVGEHIAFSIEHLLDGASLEVDRATSRTMPGPCAPESRLGPGQPVPWPRAAGRDGSPVEISRIEPGVLGSSDVAGLTDLARGALAVVPDDPERPALTLTWSNEVMRCAVLWFGFGGDRQPPWYGTARLLAVEPMSLLPWDDPERLPVAKPGEAIEYSIRVTLEDRRGCG